jgi:hypothetical protein
VRCQALWGYEAAIQGSDLILGYPFLKIFRLVVDCPSDSLKSVPTPTPFSPQPSKKRPPTPTRLLSPSPTHPTSVAYPGGESNPFPPSAGETEGGSSPPLNPPGFKTKAAWPDVQSALSSRPDSQSPRRAPGRSTADPPVTPPTTLYLPHSPPGISSSGMPVAVPATFPPPLGAGASTPTDTPTTTFFQCSSCQRISPIPDFDCGCMFPGHHSNQFVEGALAPRHWKRLVIIPGLRKIFRFPDLPGRDQFANYRWTCPLITLSTRGWWTIPIRIGSGATAPHSQR